VVDIDNIRNFAVIGGGVMGSGIAQVALLSGYENVTVIDLNSAILEKSRALIQQRIEALESEEKCKEFFSYHDLLKNLDYKKKLENFEAVGIVANNFDTKTIMNRLSTETDLSKGVSDADFVIEAVSEKMNLKQDIFKQLGEYVPPQTVLASNTSSMSITKISQDAKNPEKVIGMHFHTFFPIIGMLIEITPGEKSSKESLETGYKVAQKFPCIMGERFTVQLEKETPGLIANRLAVVGSLYFNWLMDQALDNGISREQLNAANFTSEVADAIGIDTIYYVSKYFEENLSPEFAPSQRLTELFNAGKFGKKVGEGFYKWNADGAIKNLPPVEEKTTNFLTNTIDIEMHPAIQFNEACRLLEEGVVTSYELIDKVQLKGTHMPGPFALGKTKYKEWAEKLHKFVEISGKTYLEPSEMMKSGKFLDYK
jgi:enoyl-CoA hydratase/3-hydroxyacyl-CoA dehydrogenase